MPRIPLPYNPNTLPEDARTAIVRARLAPTMAEAARIYFAALDRAGVGRPVISR